MKPKSQIAILKTIVKWQAEEIDTLEALLWLAKKAHPNALTNTSNSLGDVTLRVQIQTPEEHAWVKTQRWYRATQTPVPLWTTGGRNGNGAV